MTCTEYQQMISRLLDFESKAAESAVLFQHLGNCGQCREFLDTMARIGLELDKVQPPMDQVMNVAWQGRSIAAHEASHPPLVRGTLSPRPSTVLFAIVVSIVIGLVFSTQVTIEKPLESAPAAVSTAR